MFNLFGKIFGSEKALSGIVEGVTNGLDALVYTDEEKANDAANDRKEARQMVTKWMLASQGQNIARRFIAIVVTLLWALQHVIALTLSVAGVWVGDSINIDKSVTLILRFSETTTSAMMLVLGFYFAAPYMGDIAKSALQKFSKGNTKND